MVHLRNFLNILYNVFLCKFSARRQIIYPVEDLKGNSPVEQVLYNKVRISG